MRFLPWPFAIRAVSYAAAIGGGGGLNGSQASAGIVAAARKGGFLGEGRTDFEIALHEAIANAVLHGNKADPNRSVRVRLYGPVSYTHLRAHETPEHLVCRLLLE